MTHPSTITARSDSLRPRPDAPALRVVARAGVVVANLSPEDLPGEIWKPIPGFGIWYEASSLGRVRSWRGAGAVKTGVQRRSTKPRILRQAPEVAFPYYRVDLYSDGNSRCFRVHRLVLLAFSGPPPPGMIACHNNGNGLDNRPENLRWDTYKSNSLDKVAHGSNLAGERIYTSKLTDAVVAEAKRRSANGETLVEIAKSLGNISESALSRAVRGKQWAHVVVTAAVAMLGAGCSAHDYSFACGLVAGFPLGFCFMGWLWAVSRRSV